ncbi:hypothetical protein [Plantactinospora sp. B24E8]|uniref:hypothetical protein n=1 Tax=Plantactinospora sp. B24E8 TaxID=3153567 RepID=UPI00325F1343
MTKRLWRKVATGAAVTALMVVGGLAATASPAAAHTERSAIDAACGTSYNVVSDGRRDVRTAAGALYGYVVLTYSAATGNNCVVTYKHAGSPYHGVSTRTVACLQLQGQGGTNCYGDDFLHWAERIRYAAGVCVRYWGYIYSQPGGGTSAFGIRDAYANCG